MLSKKDITNINLNLENGGTVSSRQAVARLLLDTDRDIITNASLMIMVCRKALDNPTNEGLRAMAIEKLNEFAKDFE